MFVVVPVEDSIWLYPSDFADGREKNSDAETSQIKKAIQSRYVDRIIPDNGLGVTVYDITNIGDAVIHPTDNKNYMGQAEFKVSFRLIVFRPFIGEWLEGTILTSSEQGVQATIGFFANIHISAANLQEPAVFTNGTWLWLYRDPEDETARPVKFFYEIGGKIRFKVLTLIYGEDPEPPLKILAAMNEPGLGRLSWW